MKVIIGMSGGVDSSVSALLLQQNGYEVIGITIKLFDCNDKLQNNKSGCCNIDGVASAKAICNQLKIPHYIMDADQAFEKSVLRASYDSYASGHTPNPCALCNRSVKMKALIDVANIYGADLISTGHYIHRDGNRFFRSGDSKDQTYFLSLTPVEYLRRCIFPLAGLTKPQVRDIARKHNLFSAEKKESMDLCFTDGDVGKTLCDKYGTLPGGNIIFKGNIVGQHNGTHNFTIGQRKGIGVSFPNVIIYVKEIIGNDVILGTKEQLQCAGLKCGEINWIGAQQRIVNLQTRYGQKPFNGILEDDKIIFDCPQSAIAKGQVVAIYNGNELLGGSLINGLIKEEI
jgi:tRNA-specific 2-thiouridylase